MKIDKVAASFAAVVIGAAVPVGSAFATPASGHDDVNVLTETHQVPGGIKKNLKYAEDLFAHGMYEEASKIFRSAVNDPVAQGMAVLCDVKMQVNGYETELEKYIDKYPYSGLVPQLRYAHGLNLFDIPDYPSASSALADVNIKGLYKDQIAEYTFKKAYSDFEIGLEDSALAGFTKVTEMPKNGYQAPSQYSIAYIWYEREKFTEAEKWFAKSRKDPRFAEVSSYYIMECRFMNKDYKYVADNGAEMYASVPEERKQHLARIISESYLVLGDAAKAKEYYDKTGVGSGKSRTDYFYAGSLLYALEDYKGAIENYGMMTDRADSLGQIANYQMAYSYIKTKNKVAAMQSFKDASQLNYNTDMQEDAYFNYAKLAFDLNHDPSVFDSYIKKYPELAKGDRIYSYIALAALYNRDYAGAVEAYDKIDELDNNMKSNYMKANYLRADQLIADGSYRKAVPCLKAAAYYSDKHSPFNQLSRYWLAESYYRDDDWSQSADLFKTLYNISALEGKAEGRLLPYDIAYCYFKSGDYDNAEKWFDVYVASGDKRQRRDALTRKGDCNFIRKDYGTATASYEMAIKEFPQMDDLYPYYQAGLAYALTDNQKAEISLLAPTVSASPEATFYSETVYELGRAYMGVGANADARRVFTRLATAGRDSTYQARALIGLGMISVNESQFDEALGYYKKVVSEMPSSEYSEDALRAIESIYQTKQEPEQYFAYLKTLSGGQAPAESDKETMFFNAAEQIFLAENYQKALTTLQAYLEEYPNGSNILMADFYMAECYKNLGKKEQACDWYRKVIESGEGSFLELSSLNFAKLSYGLQRYSDAYAGYKSLLDNARIENNRHAAIVGMMNSAYAGKDYDAAIESALKLAADKGSSKDDIRRAQYVEAKSYLATSRRTKAFEILAKLSSATKTPEGAEAAYMIIQDKYDQGKFQDVENLVYKFSDSGTDQTYWLAKAFIALGDAFAERGDLKQAKATFESIRDGYTPSGKTDDVLDNVSMRLGKLEEMGE